MTTSHHTQPPAEEATSFEIAAEVRRAITHCCSLDVAYLDGNDGSPMLLTDYETGTVWQLTLERVLVVPLANPNTPA